MSQQTEISPRVRIFVVVRGDASHEGDEGLEGVYLVELTLNKPLPLMKRSAALSAHVAEAALDCFRNHQGVDGLDDVEISVLLSDGQVLEQADQLDREVAVEGIKVEQARYFGKPDTCALSLPVLSMMVHAVTGMQPANEDNDRIEAVLSLPRDAAYFYAMEEQAREAVLWLQRDAAYLYAKAAQTRNGDALAKDWLATKIQESAAHSAALARSIQFGDDSGLFDDCTDVQIQRANHAGESYANDGMAGGQRTWNDEDVRLSAHRV